MKTLNQYINEKLVINKNTKINNSHIDEPSINVPENAFKETKDINFNGVKFTYDLTILACDVEDPSGERFNLLDKQESDNYYDSYETGDYRNSIFKCTFYVIITNHSINRSYSLEFEIMFENNYTPEIQDLNSSLDNCFDKEKDIIQDMFPDILLNNILNICYDMWNVTPNFDASDIIYELEQRYED